MLARTVLSRLAAGVPATSAHDLPQLARPLQRRLITCNALSLPATRAISWAYKVALVDARRSYAATKQATKPAGPAKKAGKPKATEKAAPKKTAATKTKAATTTKKPAANKPAAKKSAAKKPAAKKPAAKKSTKAPAKKRAKKVPTPEEQKAAKIRELKKVALKAPSTPTPLQGRHVFISEALSGKTDVKAAIGDVHAKWSALTPAEMEHYNHLAGQKTAAKKAEYEAWIKSHSVDEIRIANNARAQLRRLLPPTKTGKHAHTSKLSDDRQGKRPRTSYLAFFMDRRESGDFKGISTTEAAKLIGSEWSALAANDKKKYEEQAESYNRKLAATQA